MIAVYDNSFNANEWYVIFLLVTLNILILVIPKIFSLLEGIAYYLYGFYIGILFDHTIAVRPWDLYDVNDNSGYQFIDLMSYFMFCAPSYIFMYLYVKLRIKGFKHIIYVLAWTCLSILMEWIGVKVGLYHYNMGYKIYWSVPIYVFVQSVQLIFYHMVKAKLAKENLKRA